MTIAYRLAELGDYAFIVSGWSTSYRTSWTAGMIAMEDWAAVMRPQIEKVLARPDCVTMVAYRAADRDRTTNLVGFISFERWDPDPPLVFYVYVRQTRRKSGIARGLFAAAGIDPTAPFSFNCTTATSTHIERANKIPLARWRPLLARYPKSSGPLIEVKRNPNHG